MNLAKKCIYLSLGMHFIAIVSSTTWSVDAQTMPAPVSGISLRQVELVLAPQASLATPPVSTPEALYTPPVSVVETQVVTPSEVVLKPKVEKVKPKDVKSVPKNQTEDMAEPVQALEQTIAAVTPEAQEASPKLSGVESVLIPPQLLSDADSTPYPKMAKRLRQQGVTLLKVKVSEHGECQQVDLLTSSGFDLLDRAAMDSAKNWLFESAQRDGQKVSAWVEIPVHFSIRG